MKACFCRYGDTVRTSLGLPYKMLRITAWYKTGVNAIGLNTKKCFRLKKWNIEWMKGEAEFQPETGNEGKNWKRRKERGNGNGRIRIRVFFFRWWVRLPFFCFSSQGTRRYKNIMQNNNNLAFLVGPRAACRRMLNTKFWSRARQWKKKNFCLSARVWANMGLADRPKFSNF